LTCAPLLAGVAEPLVILAVLVLVGLVVLAVVVALIRGYRVELRFTRNGRDSRRHRR
jgi:Tfp pilus assembly protein PilX